MSINACFITVQIISRPQYYHFINKTFLVYLVLRLPNPKKGHTFCYAHGFFITQSISNLYLWYNKTDYIIVYANIVQKNTQKDEKIKNKHIIVNITKSFPASIDH